MSAHLRAGQGEYQELTWLRLETCNILFGITINATAGRRNPMENSDTV